MDKKISVRMVAIIVVIVAITAGILGVKLGNNQNVSVAPAPVSVAPAKNSAVATSANDAVTVPADWKTYTNTKHGIELRYPSDWQIIDNNDANFLPSFSGQGGKTSISLGSLFIPDTPGISGPLVSKGSIDENINEILAANKWTTLGTLISIVNGKGFYGFDNNPPSSKEPFPILSAHLVGKNDVIIMTYGTAKAVSAQEQDLFKKIISTFKFTN